uniref:Uncharacterized protein n=1 Tax=Arundo donax TaxID=35708 RepID=A0A0A9GZD6_ARUDO
MTPSCIQPFSEGICRAKSCHPKSASRHGLPHGPYA